MHRLYSQDMSDLHRNIALGKALAALLVSAATFIVSAPAWADNPLGLYIGGGVGGSHVRDDNLNGFVENHTGWKALIGIHPIHVVGVEAEYTDFGHPGASSVTVAPGLTYNVDASQKAASLFGLVYAPLPLPVIDIYAKAGVSRLKLTLNQFSATSPCGNGCTQYIVTGSSDRTDTKFAYGAGVQSRLPMGFTVRAEYERIASPFGDPDALTVSAVWRF